MGYSRAGSSNSGVPTGLGKVGGRSAKNLEPANGDVRAGSGGKRGGVAGKRIHRFKKGQGGKNKASGSRGFGNSWASGSSSTSSSKTFH